MNSYKVLADSYKKLLDSGKFEDEKQAIQEHIKVLEFMAECSESEIAKIFDSGAFNDIVKAYCKRAMNTCYCSKAQIKEVQDELDQLFNIVSASDIIEKGRLIKWKS